MSSETMVAALRGISGVHVTPYTAEGEPDWAGVVAVVRGIGQAGIHNIVSAGDIGEF